MLKRWPGVLLLALAGCARSGYVDGADPCEDVTCAGHGRCSAYYGVAVCECDDGFVPSGRLACVSQAAARDAGEQDRAMGAEGSVDAASVDGAPDGSFSDAARDVGSADRAGQDVGGLDIGCVEAGTPGSRVRCFGEDGLVAPGLSGPAFASLAASQRLQDDRLVIAGTIYNGHDWDFFAAVLRTDGSLDSSFGEAGRRIIDLGRDDRLAGLALAPEGRLAVIGTTTSGYDSDVVVALLGADGAPLPDFGVSGVLRLELGASDESGVAIAWLEGGDLLLLAGQHNGHDRDAVLVRLDPSGSLVSGFGSAGELQLDVAGAADDRAVDLIVLPDGDVLVALNQPQLSNADQAFALVRLDQDGGLRSSFGDNGVWRARFEPGQSEVSRLAASPDGAVYVLGKWRATDRDPDRAKVARLSGGAGWDPSTCSTGVCDVGGGAARRLAIDAAGRLLVLRSGSDGSLLRLLPSGAIDSTFVPTGLSYFDWPSAEVAALSTGDHSVLSGRGRLIHRRLGPSGGLDLRFGTNGEAALSLEHLSDATPLTLALAPGGGLRLATYLMSNSVGSLLLHGLDAAGEPGRWSEHNAEILLPSDNHLYTVMALQLEPDGSALELSAHGEFHGNSVVTRRAADGQIDPRFGTQGNLALPPYDRGAAYSILARAPGDKTLACGIKNTNMSSHWVHCCRLNAWGSFDTATDGDAEAWGQTGCVADFFGVESTSATLSDVAVLPDGRVLAAGHHTGPEEPGAWGVLRWTSAGALDTSFGISGVVLHDPSSGPDHLERLALLPDGRFLAAGEINNGANADLAVMRLLADGQFDSSFGEAGVVRQQVGTGDDHVTALQLLDDGRFLVGGHCQRPAGPAVFVARFTARGDLDPSFAQGGVGVYEVGFAGAELKQLEVLPGDLLAVLLSLDDSLRHRPGVLLLHGGGG